MVKAGRSERMGRESHRRDGQSRQKREMAERHGAAKTTRPSKRDDEQKIARLRDLRLAAQPEQARSGQPAAAPAPAGTRMTSALVLALVAIRAIREMLSRAHRR